MSVSKVEICNIALSKLNAENIVIPGLDSRGAELCEIFYSNAVDSVLRSYLWNCAKARTSLARQTAVPAFGWKYQFTLPVDCLRVIRCEPDVEYEIECRNLLCDESAISILYIGRIAEYDFDPLLVEVVALDLAAKIAFPVSGNASLTAKMEDSLQKKLLEARSVNSMENHLRGRNRIKQNSVWDKSRY